MPDTTMGMDEQVDESLKEAAAHNGLTFRLFKTDRDDPNMHRILKIAGGYVSEEFMQLYLDQLRVDQGRMPLSGVEGAGRGIQRWEDLRAYVAIDNKKVLNSLGIIGKWYNVGFPEDKTGSSEVKITWSDTGKSIPDESIKKHMMELAVVCADGRCCKGLGRLTTAFCIQYVDFLNAKRKVNADGGYTYIIATLGKKQGSVNPKFAKILADFGFKKVDLKNDVGEPWRSGGVRIEAMMLKRPRGATFLPYANIEELIRITSEAQPRATPAPRTKPQRARPSSGGKATGMKLAVVCNGAKRYAKRRLPADYVYVPPPPRGSLKRNCKRKGAAAQEDDIFDDEVGEAERRLNDFAVHQVVSPGLHVQKRARHDSRPETPPSSDDSIPLTELAILNGHGSGATQSLLDELGSELLQESNGVMSFSPPMPSGSGPRRSPRVASPGLTEGSQNAGKLGGWSPIDMLGMGAAGGASRGGRLWWSSGF